MNVEFLGAKHNMAGSRSPAGPREGRLSETVEDNCRNNLSN
jgi:hypothetical protein